MDCQNGKKNAHKLAKYKIINILGSHVKGKQSFYLYL